MAPLTSRAAKDELYDAFASVARALGSGRRAEIVDVLEPPFHAVPAGDPVREAVDLLSGQTEALLVTEDGRPAGIVTRADLLESLASL